jgi:outer membrane lipoprotein-sorting protein
MIRHALAGAAAVLALSGTTAAQTADEIIARSFAARGGLDKVKAIRSLRMVGKATMAPDTDVPVTIEIKRPSSLRLEFAFEGSYSVQAYDGRRAWGVPPRQTQPRALPAEAAKAMAQQADLEGPLADHVAKGHKVTLVGRQPVDGEDAWKLRVTRKDGDVEYHYIDAKTYLPVRVSVERAVGGTRIQSETTLRDYRKIGGYLWPFTLESGASGRTERQRIRLRDVDVNPEIDDSRFAMPAARR